MLTLEVAKGIINEVMEAVKDWRTLVTKIGIAKREMSLFEEVFENRTNFNKM
jgi:serine/threonine-protein kinase HipA